MAAGAFTASISDVEASQKYLHVFGTIAVTAGDYAAGGLTLNFAGLSPNLASQAVPVQVVIMSAIAAAGTPSTALYLYTFAPGSTQLNGKMQIFTGAAAQSGLAELGNGALPAGVTADSIIFEAWFKKL